MFHEESVIVLMHIKQLFRLYQPPPQSRPPRYHFPQSSSSQSFSFSSSSLPPQSSFSPPPFPPQSSFSSVLLNLLSPLPPHSSSVLLFSLVLLLLHIFLALPLPQSLFSFCSFPQSPSSSFS